MRLYLCVFVKLLHQLPLPWRRFGHVLCARGFPPWQPRRQRHGSFETTLSPIIIISPVFVWTLGLAQLVEKGGAQRRRK
jgi:hypothetical protein